MALLEWGSPASIATLGIVAITAFVSLVHWCWHKFTEKRPFSKVDYWLEDGERHNHKASIKIQEGEHQIHIQLKPRVKYTISEVDLRFLSNSQDEVNRPKISSFEDKRRASQYDFKSKEDTSLGFIGSYTPHRVVSKNDLVNYVAKFSVKGSWQEKLELSLRITTEEFGRHSTRFECIWQPTQQHKHIA